MRFLLRWLKRLLLIALLAVAAGLGVMYLQDPVLTTRLVSLPFGGSQGPVDPVPGGPPLELRSAGEVNRSISAEALAAAVAYGAQTGSHALLVYHHGELQLEHYYPGYDASSISATQSMHKSVLALLVGVAIRDGYIGSVDDPAARYLPEWANDGRAAITLRQMLQQSSGIGFPQLGFNPLGGFFQLVLGDDIAPVVLGQPLEDPPGTRFDYNSVNTEALGIIIERATGQPYADYLSRALWRYIGANDAEVVLDSVEHATPRVFCCLGATARSWLAVGLLHLHQGRVGNRQVVPAAWMQQVIAPAPHNPNYGYLTWLGNEYAEYRAYNHKTATRAYQSAPFAAPDMVYFDGFGGSRVYIVRSLGLVIVRTGNIATDWDDARLPNTIIAGIRAP